MVGTRSKAELEHNSSSDSEAPEQVTLSLGREKAQNLRKEERENQRRVQAEAKQRRQRSAAKKKQEVSSDKQEEAPVGDSLEEATVNPAQNEQDEQDLKFSKSAKISGFLDTSIIDFLSAQEKKKGGEVITSTPEHKNPRLRIRAGKRKGSKNVISSSRVKVVLLEGDQPLSANLQNALDFKAERLYGERFHRSVKMLSKPTSAQQFRAGRP